MQSRTFRPTVRQTGRRYLLVPICFFFFPDNKDGDYSTSWTCVAGVLDCTLVIDLFYYRHIKQVKIGER